ncbi:MAG: RnfABCDGE type electron transport complex subunit D [Clostridia bacterium]|nr:RnfABCDGE type electron transport complex subunit D [Clostridia bacterium]
MQKLAVTSSPHLRAKASTRSIMLDVCIALIPAGVAGCYWFGLRAALLIALCVGTCVASEWLYQVITKQKVTVGDFSAVVTGLLLAYNLPANAPWWIAVIGSFLAIVLVKQIFGGLGCNFMNPTLAARAILFISWGTIMASYPVASGNFVADAATGATALATINGGSVGNVTILNQFIGNCGGVLGETCKAAILLGGIYLLLRGVISWHIPVSFIATAFICYLIKDGAEIALLQVLSGGMLLGAFFMATDYVTSPVTNAGKIIFGIGCGFFLFVIRAFASYPEGCSFAILFMNVVAPLIDKLCAPKAFGEVKKHG